MVYQKTVSKQVNHWPRLDTLLMVEDALRKCKDYPTKTKLWKSLPKKVMYQTFCRIIDYLEASNKVVIDEGKLIWIHADNRKLSKLVKDSVRV